ncbi:hypothetical protein GCM10009623_19190 [Nocardioides aestuarii]|uniref:Alpha/beta hydrolase n=1 Tax=Nocardioides aestuarii TaxID=252231 RepID=A0ABW4TN58_9ACTN
MPPRSRTVRPVRAALATVLTAALALSAAPATAAPGAGARPSTSVPGGDVGRWKVRAAGPGEWVVTWRSPARLPVTSDRPTIVHGGTALGVPTVRADGRTVTTSVASPTRPDPAALDVVLSGDRLDVAGSDVPDQRTARSSAVPRLPALEADPAEPGSYETSTTDYELAPVPLPGMPEPIEMVGHVVEPVLGADAGPRPLVLFLHGRHSFCYDPTESGADEWSWPCQAPAIDIPSHLGYDYIQQVLASQGYATVSVRVNGINAQDYRLADGGADARAAIVQAHLDHWVDLADEHQVDLDQVVLVGHSRGGEGVDRASIQIDADAPYRIAGQVLLAPTNFGTQSAPYVPTVTVLPSCDGDVFDLQGQRFTDSGRDLFDDDTSLKSSVFVSGANHNFFNTEWTPGLAEAPAWDDWGGGGPATLCGEGSPTRLTATEQQRVGVAYVAGAVALFTRDDQEVLPLFDGSVVRPPTIGAADVRSHAIGGGRDVRGAGTESGLALADGATTAFCRGVLSQSGVGACGKGYELYGQVPHWYDARELAPSRPELEMSWSAVGQSGGLRLDEPLDLSSGRLELRTIVDPTRGDVRLRLRLTDADGTSAVVTPADDGLVRALPSDRRSAKRWAQTVIADPAEATGIDLSRVEQVEVIGDSEDGRIWVLDLAAAPDTLAAVPDTRAATVSMGSLRLREGDTDGTAVAEVPWTVDGTLTEPAELLVGISTGWRPRDREVVRLDVAPGQTSGTIPVEYESNDLDDYGDRFTQLEAHPVDHVMTDAYVGVLRVVDDDPRPRMSFTTPRRVAEGDQIPVRVRIEGGASYPLYAAVEVVRGSSDREPLRIGDLPVRWLAGHDVAGSDPRTPLHRAGVYLGRTVRPGDHTVTLTMPTRVDRVDEGVEVVTFSMDLGRREVRRTVRVVD